MYIDSFGKRYSLNEFNYYGVNNGDSIVYVVELVIDMNINDFDEDEFRTPIVIGAESQFVLMGYTLNEWYEDNGAVKVVYVK